MKTKIVIELETRNFPTFISEDLNEKGKPVAEISGDEVEEIIHEALENFVNEDEIRESILDELRGTEIEEHDNLLQYAGRKGKIELTIKVDKK